VGSSNFTRRIGVMAFSGILAVASLRFALLINVDAATVYLSSLVNTFQELLRFNSPIGIVMVLAMGIAIAFGFKRDRFVWITVVTGVAGLFVVGSWLTQGLYPTLGYNDQSTWLIVLIVINLLFSSLFLGLPLSLLGLFFYDALRPE
jgi:hypothetical protein